MKNIITSALAATTLIGLASQTLAHRSWILPSTTVLSGENPWVTFDAAVSNNLFFPNHHAPDLESFTVTGPEGNKVALQNGNKGQLRTTFDLELTKSGTYRIATVRSNFGAFWKEGEERKRWRGTKEEFVKQEIAKKPNVAVSQGTSRTETFVTSGEPNKTAIKPTGKGLEIAFTHNHPNDLFAGETATFTLHNEGKPTANAKVTIVKGNDRFRNEVGEITATTDAKGEFSIKWPSAGRFWVNTTVQADAGKLDGAPLSNRSSYTATFEVLPE